MRPPRLLLVLDPERVPPGTDLPGLAARAVAGGADAVQVRARGEHAAMLPNIAAAVRDRVGGSATVLVGGDPALAAALGIGLHLPERGMPPAEARALLGPGAAISRSVHGPGSTAASAGADWLLAGHVWPSRSHPGAPPLGLAGFSAIAAAAPCPVLAIGGVASERAGEAVRVGAAGIAVIDAIAAAPDPQAAARALRSAIDLALERRMETTSNQTAADLAITVNGKPYAVPAGSTVHDFLAGKRLADSMAIVERNGVIVARAAYGETALEAGDVLEVVHAVGGG